MKNIQCDFCKKECCVFDKSHELVRQHLILNDSSIHNLIIFYEYLSPNTSSNLSKTLSLEESDLLLEKMLKKDFEVDKNYIFTANPLSQDLLKKMSLDGDLTKSSCKRFISNVCPKDKKNNLTSLMRHIRNSIAHGRYFIIKGGNYYKFLFEDVNEKDNVTFRMVINHSTLKKWKDILMN